MIIDLRSDTVTRPGKEMLEYMSSAVVGDMVMDEDPSVNKLEEDLSTMFGLDAGLFCPSGTMSNQIAIKIHTVPGDDVICSKLAHIYQYEGGGIAFNSGASVSLIDTPNGIFTPTDVLKLIQPDDPHHPKTSLVSVENTVNKGGGAVWEISQMAEVAEVCKEKGLAYHLDGARIFNALAASGNNPSEIGSLFNTISVCLSKGLGAPVGSVLLGSHEEIKKGKRIRKVLGGTMRQAGYLAAAGSYALKHNVGRLADDHAHAQVIGETLKTTNWVEKVYPVETNIILASVKTDIKAGDVVSYLSSKGLLCFDLSDSLIRMVTHLDISTEMVSEAVTIIKTAVIKPYS